MDTQKHFLMMQLLTEVRDPLIDKFFDINSDKMLDKKIKVLKQLANGEEPNSRDFRDILELYPNKNKNNIVEWD